MKSTTLLKAISLSCMLAMGMAGVVAPVSAQAALAMDFSPLVEQVSDGVVRVTTTKRMSEEELALARKAQAIQQFFGGRVLPNIPTVEYGYGTGFFVSQDGYLLTNHHVVDGADTITITLKDRSELDAVLIGSDESSDIAVLKVKGGSFPALKVAQADTLKVGEPVLAIGSPFGFDYSASAGIVSAKSRNFSREATVPFIQSDVTLNQGNSGGPLFNKKGEVVGVNSRIFSSTGGHMGLSFSIPIDIAMDIYGQIKSTGKVTRMYLGVSLQDIDRTLAEAYKLSRPQGALINRVMPDSPAQKAGLQAGDVVLQFNGNTITQASDLMNLINRAKLGERFNIIYQRAGNRQSTQGIFAEAAGGISVGGATSERLRLGLRLKELSPHDQAMLARYGASGGVVVSSVDVTGLAHRAGLQSGDIIVSLNQLSTYNMEQFGRAVASLPSQGVITIGIIRDGLPAIVGLRIE